MRLASVARCERVTGYRLEKSLRLCLGGLRIRGLDPIAKTSELSDHSRRAPLFRLFGDGWAAFFVMNSLVQDQPDQPALSMGNGPDGLVVQFADLLVDQSQLLQRDLQPPPVDGVQLRTGAERVAQLFRRGAQALISQSGQRRWVGFPVSERLQHPPGTEAEQIGDEAGQLDRTFR